MYPTMIRLAVPQWITVVWRAVCQGLDLDADEAWASLDSRIDVKCVMAMDMLVPRE